MFVLRQEAKGKSKKIKELKMVGFRIRFTQPTGDRRFKSQQSSKIASVEGIKAGDSASEKCGIGNQVVPRPLILGQSRPLSRRRPQSTMNPNPV
jgi:hypothetical protein